MSGLGGRGASGADEGGAVPLGLPGTGPALHQDRAVRLGEVRWRQRLVRLTLLPDTVPLDKAAGRFQELLILYLPHPTVLARGQRQVGDELPKPPIGE
ncbi:MAG: hypothetical protein JO112_08705 [Planctomycetes bacterium]|nr:hypothetical protein [Planctomycetota bacterium]